MPDGIIQDRGVAAEAVEDPARSGNAFQRFQHFRISLAQVDDGRQVPLKGECKLRDKQLDLQFHRIHAIPAIEADLADGHGWHGAVAPGSQQTRRIERSGQHVLRGGGIRRMQPGGIAQLRMSGAQLAGLVQRLDIQRGEHSADDAGRRHAFQHLRAVVIE